jgi:hypothetical protein
MPQQILRQIEALLAAWCKLMHVSVRWPIHNRYECARCGRRYPVSWQAEAARRTVERRRPLATEAAGHLP